MSFKTPRATVTGLGSAKEGVHHWWAQRVTAVALVPLTVLFVFPFGQSLGGSYEEALATYQNPFHAIIAVLFIAVAFRHMALGLQVVIEDYVHAPAIRTASLLANTLLCTLFAVTGVLGVAKVFFGG
ncbi:succinate dehydrogenase, hydrophobic membrane anchor protein [Rhodovulum sp. DZ06]|uniref:succinate dehydrogenase, hydrophobic membrane anchor protein n=1 Tax=Rhodovulum sp. DZ06 TaxID=3425126 RepID=UPI003D32BC3E